MCDGLPPTPPHPSPLPLPPRNALNPFNFTAAAVRKKDETHTDDCLIYVWLPPRWSMSGREGFAEWCLSRRITLRGWMKLKSHSSPSLWRHSGWNDTKWKIVDRKGGGLLNHWSHISVWERAHMRHFPFCSPGRCCCSASRKNWGNRNVIVVLYFIVTIASESDDVLSL